MRFLLVLAVASGVAGCTQPPAGTDGTAYAGPAARQGPVPPTAEAAQMFVSVVRAVEPAAEALCRNSAPRSNCDFKIVIDDTDPDEANAHQFLTRGGRPVLSFNFALLNAVRNADELAFVMGHEAGHHIAGHLARQEVYAREGAAVMAQMATANGANASEISTARALGAALGALRYSKEFELEADRLGTIIALRAGYDPVLGALFFHRIDNPGDEMLGTHPPNADRISAVKRTAFELTAPAAAAPRF